MGNCICTDLLFKNINNKNIKLYTIKGLYRAKVVDVYDGDTITIVIFNKLWYEKHKFRLNGIYYLLSLRLIPTISFVLINLIMGVLPISLFRFYYISQLGMLPATVIYVNAGSEISKVNSINDILSFTLIVSFILIATLPILIKFLMNYFIKLNNI